MRSVNQRRRRCSAWSCNIWQRWQRALRLRGRLFAGSWSRCAAAKYTRVERMSAKEIVLAPKRKRRPFPSRQVSLPASHHRPSPRWRTTWPCGRRQFSQRPFARSKRITPRAPSNQLDITSGIVVGWACLYGNLWPVFTTRLGKHSVVPSGVHTRRPDRSRCGGEHKARERSEKGSQNSHHVIRVCVIAN
jgi:hypothetical protein